MTGAVGPFWPLALKDYSSLVTKGGRSSTSAPGLNRGYAADSGSMPNVSFTAIRSFCLHPRYRSVVWIET